MYGKTDWGVQRSTFIVGTDGKVAAVLNKVKPGGSTTRWFWLRWLSRLRQLPSRSPGRTVTRSPDR